jgi:hypothetical protein
MHPVKTLMSCSLLALLTSAPVWSQQTPANPQVTSPARDLPRPDQLEPGVNTSATPAAASPAPAASTVPAAATVPAATAKPRTATASAQAKDQPRVPPKTGAATGKAQDRLELDATQITGNRELPKVLYIVPWKRSDLGDLVGKPVNSLLDEVLAPVDRDVFKRENRYYDALQPDAGAAAPAAAPGK